MKNEYEIREVEAWRDGEGWTYNQTWKVCTVKSAAKDEKRLFADTLRKYGWWFRPGAIRIVYDGSIYEVIDSKTQEPLFCMIPNY